MNDRTDSQEQYNFVKTLRQKPDGQFVHTFIDLGNTSPTQAQDIRKLVHYLKSESDKNFPNSQTLTGHAQMFKVTAGNTKTNIDIICASRDSLTNTPAEFSLLHNLLKQEGQSLESSTYKQSYGLK